MEIVNKNKAKIEKKNPVVNVATNKKQTNKSNEDIEKMLA